MNLKNTHIEKERDCVRQRTRERERDLTLSTIPVLRGTDFVKCNIILYFTFENLSSPAKENYALRNCLYCHYFNYEWCFVLFFLLFYYKCLGNLNVSFSSIVLCFVGKEKRCEVWWWVRPWLNLRQILPEKDLPDWDWHQFDRIQHLICH